MLLAVCLLPSLLVNATNEDLTHRVFASAGSVMSTPGVATLSFTIGESVVSSLGPAGQVRLAQGFQQVELTPLNATIQNITIEQGNEMCYGAINTLTVAGDNTTVTVNSGGSLTLKAGMAIYIRPTTVVDLNGYMLAQIVTNGSFCNPSVNDFLPVTQHLLEPEPIKKTEAGLFTLYPNPTTGSAKIVYHGKEELTASNVLVFNLQGKLIDDHFKWNHNQGELSLQSSPPGTYLIKVTTKESNQTFRLIKL